MANNGLMRAMEVESVSFSKVLRGYAADEVDDFLDRVADSLQRYAEIVANNEIRIRQLEEQLTEYGHLKDSLQEALLMAKHSSEEHVKAAQKESEALVAEARSRAEAIIAEAQKRYDSLLRQYEDLQRDREHFVADARALVLRFNSLLDRGSQRVPSQS